MFGNSTCDCCGRDDIMEDSDSRIESLEETIAELREELRVALIGKEDALADLEDVEDMIKGVEGLYDYWVRKTKRST